jgi:SAM-dependent methyltransferase
MGYRTKIKRKIINILTRKHIEKLFVKWEKTYGIFDSNNYDAFSVDDLSNESGFYHGELIKWSADLYPNCVLFAGENTKTATYLKEKINAKKVITAGLSEVDYRWNFEHTAPDIPGKIDLIISHAIFEHLLNPYKHLSELARLVETQGVLIIHTVMPGFRYHRYPVDTLRFYPDWFEEMADRLQLKIVNKRIKEDHIFYMYQKI